MTAQNEKKLKKLAALHRWETVYLASWLRRAGIPGGVQTYYRKSGRLESIGWGALKWIGDDVRWQGGLYTVQKQARLPIHAGGMTALSLLGLAHELSPSAETVFLFGAPTKFLPRWFRNYDWKVTLRHTKTSILPNTLGLTKYQEKSFTIEISTAERAILECIYLAPDEQGLVECYQVMKGLVNLGPELLQELLEACTSIQVKRLFLYLAEKAKHPWFSRINTSRLELGQSRNLLKGCVLIENHRITVSPALAAL